jgi:hypothetical protein
MDSTCIPCASTSASTESGPAATTVAVVVLLTAIAIYYFACTLNARRARRERFASGRAHAMCEKSRQLFDRTAGAVTFSEYKTEVNGANAVLFTDTLKLWRANKLTPEAVEQML